MWLLGSKRARALELSTIRQPPLPGRAQLGRLSRTHLATTPAPLLRWQIRPLWRHYYSNTQVGSHMGGGSASVGAPGFRGGCWRKAR